MTYLVYKTDNWHSHASKDLIGIFTNHDLLIVELLKLFKIAAENEETDDIDSHLEDAEYQLRSIDQSQNFLGEGEYVIDRISESEMNQLENH